MSVHKRETGTKLDRVLVTNDLGFTVREVYQLGWSGLDRESATIAVEVLEELDWLRPQKEKTDGRPKTRYWINPRILATPRKGTGKTVKSPSLLQTYHQLHQYRP